MDQSDIDARFTLHPTSTQKQIDHADIRDKCHLLACRINSLAPDGREKSLAMTHLEEVMFWANAAIARAE